VTNGYGTQTQADMLSGTYKKLGRRHGHGATADAGGRFRVGAKIGLHPKPPPTATDLWVCFRDGRRSRAIRRPLRCELWERYAEGTCVAA